MDDEEEDKLINILIVDNGPHAASLQSCFSVNEYNITAAHTAAETRNILRKTKIDIVILNTKLPDADGADLLRELKKLHAFVEVIMLVGPTAIADAVRCMKLGANACLGVPVERKELLNAINNAYEGQRLRKRWDVSTVANELVGESKKMQEVRRLISLVGSSDAPVLILGETGTGKELISRAIHEASARRREPFVVVNAGALPENVLESELFGHKKGSFTGALSDKAGLVEIADKGTFFGDEVGEMNPVIQAKLLRVIETGTFRRLGDTRETKVNVRLVCATNKDLELEVKAKTFRADLFYRLSTFIIHVPPLRERMGDVPLLVDHFLRRMARGKEPVAISPVALDRMIDYSWPGNVRELANTLEKASILSAGNGLIGVDMLPLDITADRFSRIRAKRDRESLRLADAQREHINDVLEAVGGNKARAARILGISRTRLYSGLLGR